MKLTLALRIPPRLNKNKEIHGFYKKNQYFNIKRNIPQYKLRYTVINNIKEVLTTNKFE